nr:LOW QUALITY PROTEIN: tetratricopeptide repeat protein 12 [Drosophila takahashii]
MSLTINTLDKNKDNEKRLSLELPKPEILIYQHPETDESFLEEHPSKVVEVIECLEAIENANKTDLSKNRKKSTLNINEFPFLVTQRNERSTTTFRRAKTKNVPINTNQFTFMRQVNPDAEDRILARKQREDVAETFRRMGNFEYRKSNFALAKNYYTKGLEYIKDTPVLYVNRAMCSIKMRELKHSIMDCDYVLTHVDERYLRAWLYRAAAYKRLNDETNYEKSVDQARRLNRSQAEFIEDFLEKMRLLL